MFATKQTVHVTNHIAGHALLDVQCDQALFLGESLVSSQDDFPHVPCMEVSREDKQHERL